MIRRVGSARAGRGRSAVVIHSVTGGRPVVITHASLAVHNTEEKLRAEADRQSGRNLIDVHFHINRDGSVAVATGEAPLVWPEDFPPGD